MEETVIPYRVGGFISVAWILIGKPVNLERIFEKSNCLMASKKSLIKLPFCVQHTESDAGNRTNY